MGASLRRGPFPFVETLLLRRALLILALASAGCRADRPAPSSAAATSSTPGAPAPIAEIARAVQPGHPVIFLGLDAADWSLLDVYAQRGVMPNLAKLLAE